MISSVGNMFTNYSTNYIGATAAPVVTEATGDVEFSYNSQDKVVMEPSTTVVSGVKMGKNGPETDRVKLGKNDLQPNADDKFVFKAGEKGFTGAVTFATVNNTLKMMEEAYGDKIPWAGGRGDQIKLVPDGGEMLNAYYSRRDCSLNFFHSMDPVTNTMIMSGESGEVVSHEVGHAMLDGLRPGYLQAWSPDPGGFHESFADCMGMFMATQDDRVCENVAKQTGGDLTKQNCLAATGEELGQAINHTAGKNSTGGTFIRNAINDFKWQDPSTLPKNAPRDQLGTEMHSWSRVFTGAVYDVMTGIVNRNMAEGMEPAAAIKAAGAEMITLYGNLMKEAPRGDFTYEQMANCMLKTDSKYMDGRNSDLIRESFTNRRILPEGGDFSLQNVDYGAKEFRMMSVTLDGSGFGMFAGAKVETPVDAGKMSINEDSTRLKENMKQLIADGRILYTEPNQKIETKDLFDKDGMPYMGVVRWVDGQMVIERNTIIN